MRTSYPFAMHGLCLVPTVILLCGIQFFLGSDDAVCRYFRGFRYMNPDWTLPVKVFSNYALLLFYPVYAFFLLRGMKNKRLEDIFFAISYLLAQVLIAFLLCRIVKIAVGRPRPMTGGPFHPFSLSSGYQSFPSGHTAEVIGSFVPFLWRYGGGKALRLPLGMGFFIAAMAFTRIYLSMHHPTDIWGGLVFGSLSGYVSWRIHNALLTRWRVLLPRRIRSWLDAKCVPSGHGAKCVSSELDAKGAPRGRDVENAGILCRITGTSFVCARSLSMTKPLDDTAPVRQEPEQTANAQGMSWQSALDAAPGNVPQDIPQDAPAASSTESPAPPAETPPTSAFADAPGTEQAATPQADGVQGLPEIPPLVTEPPAAAKDMAKKGKKSPSRVSSPGPFAGKSFGPVVPAQPMMRDEDGALVPTPATVTSRLFTVLALIPIIVPVALFLVQVVFTLDTRSLWYSDEIRYAAAYQSMVESGNWLVMHLNGDIYPDKPPLFFWFLHGLSEMATMLTPLLPFAITVTENMIFFAGMALSGLLCLLATHALASLVARVDRRTVLAADLVLVGGFFFASLAHYLRMDLLFAACITISHVVLFHAWVRDKAPLLMVLGYLFAGAAVLVKGPLGLAFPLLAGLCFLVWQGRITRFFRLDSLFGLVVGLAVPGIWLALAWMNAGDAFLNNILHQQVLARALDTWHHAQPWYHYAMTLPLICLPWTLALPFLPWGRFMNKRMREGIRTSRTKDGAGIAYLWCAFLPGLILLSCVSIKLPIYCLPLFPPLAILCARAVLRMRPFATACLHYTLALVLCVLGLALTLLPAIPGNYLPLPFVPQGVMVLGGICLFFACVLAFCIKPRRGEGVILTMAVFVTVLMYPAWSVTAPSLDAFLSPRAQAEVLKTYRDAGYYPATFKVYHGTYTYYAGIMRDCPNWDDVLAQAEANPKMILALRASLWDKMENKPEGFAEVHRQTIAERDYVLVARPPLGQEPAKEAVEDKIEPPAAASEPPITPGETPVPPSAATPAPESAPPAIDAGSI